MNKISKHLDLSGQSTVVFNALFLSAAKVPIYLTHVWMSSAKLTQENELRIVIH